MANPPGEVTALLGEMKLGRKDALALVIRQNCVRTHVITLQRVHNGDEGHPPEGLR
jgi:hypothetical protein